jgi:opacity protein-like surface antigen
MKRILVCLVLAAALAAPSLAAAARKPGHGVKGAQVRAHFHPLPSAWDDENGDKS